MPKAGKDTIGIGVGAIVLNDKGEVFLAQRGELANNERGTWEFPGGSVDYGERLADAVRREFLEEYGMVIEVGELLSVDDHILTEEGQHWVAMSYVARHISGTPEIKEAGKCSTIGWFRLDALPEPLSQITQSNLRDYIAKVGTNPPD